MKNYIYLVIAALLLGGCSDHEMGPPIHGEIGVAIAASSIAGNNLSAAGPVSDQSGGPNAIGVTVPAGKGVVGRLENGLEGMAKSTQGNFSRSLAQVRTNLPKVTNVGDAAGYDQVQLLVYSACSDLVAGGTPLMQTRYNVQVNGSIASNQAALVAAGLRMLDQHTAGLATGGPAAAQLNTVFTNLVQAQAAIATNTSKMAFMTVCIAANTAGTTLLGL